MTIFSEYCHFLIGPTACGKTAYSLELAKNLNAEILSLDSVAVYQGMDIGSAKPTHAERAQVPHHLLDLVQPNFEFSVADYLHAAEIAVRDILNRDKTPLFVGGTPLYCKALIFGLFEGPPADETFREEMRMLAKSESVSGNPTFLHQRLAKIDPTTAARLHPNDERRIIRALEVFHLTGRPIHEFQSQFETEVPENIRPRVRIITLPRGVLHERINTRVDRMFDAGLLDEVRFLLKEYQALSSTASLAVGYRETIAFLESEKSCNIRSLQDLKELIKAHTRQLAKRQCTWFRSLIPGSVERFGPNTGVQKHS